MMRESKIHLHPSAQRSPDFLLRHWLERVDEIESISVVVKIKGETCVLETDWSAQTIEAFLAKSALLMAECNRAVIRDGEEEGDE